MKRVLFITTSFENGAIPNVLLDLARIGERPVGTAGFWPSNRCPKGTLRCAAADLSGFRLRA